MGAPIIDDTTEEIFIIPLEPVYNENTADTSLGTVGVAINGIPIYNPFEDQNETAAYGRIFSSCCGHPQLNGIYHYHKYKEPLLVQNYLLQKRELYCVQF